MQALLEVRVLFKGGPYVRKYGSQKGNQRDVDETHQCSFPSALFGSLFPQLVQINGELSLKGCLMYFIFKFLAKLHIIALSFYRSQNALCRSKFYESAQKFDCI